MHDTDYLPQSLERVRTPEATTSFLLSFSSSFCLSFSTLFPVLFSPQPPPLLSPKPCLHCSISAACCVCLSCLLVPQLPLSPVMSIALICLLLSSGARPPGPHDTRLKKYRKTYKLYWQKCSLISPGQTCCWGLELSRL